MRWLPWLAIALLLAGAVWLRLRPAPDVRPLPPPAQTQTPHVHAPVLPTPDPLAQAALAQVGVTIAYDPAYVSLAYPGGDVPIDRGVCSDVVVRACRKIGLDLQRELHEDMTSAFASYPQKWGLKRPDANIDQRRVLNLMTWFARHGWEQPVSADPAAFRSGDVVAWDLGRGLTHIGIVSAGADGRPQVVHNIGQGARQEDVLFAWSQIGHYRRPGPR